MPGVITHSEPLSKKEAIQKTQQEKDSESRLSVGDVVRMSDGRNYVITQYDAETQRCKGEPVRFQGNSWEPDLSRKPQVFKEEQVVVVMLRNQDLRDLAEKTQSSPKKSLTGELKDSVEEYRQNKADKQKDDVSKENTPDKNERKKDKSENEAKRSRAASFSVISNGDTDGLVTSGNSYETIVTGETTDGITFTAHSSGEMAARDTIELRVNNRVQSTDLNHEKEDESKAYDDLQDTVNQPRSVEVVEISGGSTVNRDELGIEESVPGGNEYKDDPFNFDSGISDIEKPSGTDPFDQSKSLDEILNGQGGISENSPLNTPTDDLDYIDDFDDPELSLF